MMVYGCFSTLLWFVCSGFIAAFLVVWFNVFAVFRLLDVYVDVLLTLVLVKGGVLFAGCTSLLHTLVPLFVVTCVCVVVI